MTSSKPIRVLVIDDSAIARKMIHGAMAQDSSIQVVGVAGESSDARNLVETLSPDVITLDLTMPRIDGMALLKRLHQYRPIPVLLISPRGMLSARIMEEAQHFGAMEVIAKPTSSQEVIDLHKLLSAKIKSVFAKARRGEHAIGVSKETDSARAMGTFHSTQFIVMGASTGGPEALREVLTNLPGSMPPILIAQHIPASFSKAFAKRMNQLSNLEVREGVDGDELREGLVLIAPGDYHMKVVAPQRHRFHVRLDKGPPVNHVRPSVDVLFTSAANCRDARVIACLFTGMGSDGALGMKALKEAGARTFAQDEHSCVVFGMPRAARELGVVDQCLPVDRMAEAIHRAAMEGR